MRPKYILLSLASGFLSGLSFNHPAFSFLIWFSLIPLFLVISKSSRRQTFIYSYLAGFTFFLTVVSWVRFVTGLGLFLLVFYLAFYWAVFGALSHRFITSNKNPLLPAFIWIILEWIRTNFGGFGWALLGYSQCRFIPLIQSASICGVWIVSFLIIYCNLFLSNLIFRKERPKLLRQGVFFAGLTVLMLSYGFFAFKSYPQTGDLKVSIVQPNIPQYKKWDQAYHQEITDTLLRLVKETEEDSLIVLPEASWPYWVDSSDMSLLKSFVQKASRDMIIGAVEKDEDFYNSSFFFFKSGRLLDKYRKMNLVPFGEFVPFREFLGFIEEVSAFGDISSGKAYTLFPYKGSKIAVLICFEDVFPALVSRFVKKGAGLLVNVTNDAWFRGHPEAYQHIQSAVFRAVEQRRFLVRAANTGISSIITPRGVSLKVLKAGSKDVFVEGILAGKVSSIEKLSVYNRLGDVLIYIGFIVCVLNLRKRNRS